MNTLPIDIQADIKTISAIPAIPIILEVICRTTGMGFAAVARVTTEQWVACSVRDEVQFGLLAGSELKLDTTICHEIRQSGKEVVIDHVQEDELYRNHHTPAMYGLQSYISVPIIQAGGDFFGTLCAIDPKPSLLNTPEIIGMFRSYADLISFCMNAAKELSGEETNMIEQRVTAELKQHLDSVLGLDGVNAKTIYDPAHRRDGNFIKIVQHSAGAINELLAQLKKAA